MHVAKLSFEIFELKIKNIIHCLIYIHFFVSHITFVSFTYVCILYGLKWDVVRLLGMHFPFNSTQRGDLVTNAQSIWNLWREHFSSLLNGSVKGTPGKGEPDSAIDETNVSSTMTK